jgi:hypothetical protein
MTIEPFWLTYVLIAVFGTGFGIGQCCYVIYGLKNDLFKKK